MTTLEILKAARELLAVPERWTKGVGARDSKWELSVEFAAMYVLAYAPERTHAEVLARFDDAIARLEGAATP